MGIAQGFFEIFGFRYRFITERFIVPITARKYYYMVTLPINRQHRHSTAAYYLRIIINLFSRNIF